MANIKVRWAKFIETAKSIINSPGNFFELTKKEKGYKKALEYLVILWLVGSLLTAAANVVFGYLLPLLTGTLTAQLTFVSVFVSQFLASILTAIVGVVASGVLSVVLHLWIKAFRGKGNLVKTFQLNTYALTPSMLFGWLPIANLVASIYGLYLMMIGAQKYHGLSRNKTILMFIVLPILLVIGVSYWLYTSGITLPASQ